MVRASLIDTSATQEVKEAASGLEAFEPLAMDAVQLSVHDLYMPDIHALEDLGFFRVPANYHAFPIIVLTTRGDDFHRTAALQAGATAFMTKPFAPLALAAQARQLLDSHVAPGPP